MKAKWLPSALLIATLFAALPLAIPATSWQVQAHKVKHTDKQLKIFNDLFMEQVKIGDSLFHGDAALEKKMGVNLSNTGMACAMCHPHSSDIHPHEFPKWQEQMSAFATLRDMINWCIEKPNEGEKIDVNSPAMKALEAYMYWSNRNSPLRPGTH